MDNMKKVQSVSEENMNEVQIFEMGRIQVKAVQSEKIKVSGSESFAPVLEESIGNSTQEVLQGLFMNVKNEVVYKQDLFVGRVRGINASPYQIVQSAILVNATHIILAHNHPSGCLQPSQEDIKFSKKMKEVLSHFDIILLDHFIVSSNSYFSFAEHALLKNDHS